MTCYEWTWWMWLGPFLLTFPFLISIWCTEDLILRFATVRGQIPKTHSMVLDSFELICGKRWFSKAVCLGILCILGRLPIPSINYFTAANSMQFSYYWMWTFFAIGIGLRLNSEYKKDARRLDEAGPWSVWAFMILVTVVANGQLYVIGRLGVDSERRFVDAQLVAANSHSESNQTLVMPTEIKWIRAGERVFLLVTPDRDFGGVYVIAQDLVPERTGELWSQTFKTEALHYPIRQLLTKFTWSSNSNTLTQKEMEQIGSWTKSNELRFVTALSCPYPW